MPQIYNLGGMSIQKTKEIRSNLLMSKDRSMTFIEVQIDPDDNTPMVYLRNISKIHCHGAGPVIDAELIDTTDT